MVESTPPLEAGAGSVDRASTTGRGRGRGGLGRVGSRLAGARDPVALIMDAPRGEINPECWRLILQIQPG